MDLVDATIIETTEIADLWAPWFRDRTTWTAWFAFLKVLFCLPLSVEEQSRFAACTNRLQLPDGPSREAWLVCGRRAGKSFILALIAVYLAIFRDWRPYLSPGEVPTVKVIATDRRQARVIWRYAYALLSQVSALASYIRWSDHETIELSTGVVIEIQTASFRTVRGYTIVAALLDELAFWHADDNNANPDREIINALRPAMATIPGALLLCASSPYARRGVLWDTYRRHWGEPGPVLVWKAGTRAMNPTVAQQIVDEAYEADPASASAEYGAEFRTDVETYVAREVVDAAVMVGRYELPPVSTVSYSGFVDPSGGSQDSMTLAIGHRSEQGTRVLDAVREVRPPFSPQAVVDDFCTLLRDYRITTVRGDYYGGEWVGERFRDRGIGYERADKPKSELYRELLPLLNSGQVELLDHSRLVAQLCGLERRTARGGRDSIDHPPGGHDDIVNAAAGALTLGGVDHLAAWGRW